MKLRYSARAARQIDDALDYIAQQSRRGRRAAAYPRYGSLSGGSSLRRPRDEPPRHSPAPADAAPLARRLPGYRRFRRAKRIGKYALSTRPPSSRAKRRDPAIAPSQDLRRSRAPRPDESRYAVVRAPFCAVTTAGSLRSARDDDGAALRHRSLGGAKRRWRKPRQCRSRRRRGPKARLDETSAIDTHRDLRIYGFTVTHPHFPFCGGLRPFVRQGLIPRKSPVSPARHAATPPSRRPVRASAAPSPEAKRPLRRFAPALPGDRKRSPRGDCAPSAWRLGRQDPLVIAAADHGRGDHQRVLSA